MISMLMFEIDCCKIFRAYAPTLSQVQPSMQVISLDKSLLKCGYPVIILHNAMYIVQGFMFIHLIYYEKLWKLILNHAPLSIL